MRETFHLSGQTFSINAMYGPKKFKTAAARDWEMTVLHQLNSPTNQLKFENLRAHFDVNKHSFAVYIIVEYPAAKFYNKEGNISAHTKDVSNVEKPLIDLFFLSKYFGLESPYGCRNMNADDRFITRMMSIKRPGTAYKISFSIKIIER